MHKSLNKYKQQIPKSIRICGPNVFIYLTENQWYSLCIVSTVIILHYVPTSISPFQNLILTWAPTSTIIYTLLDHELY